MLNPLPEFLVYGFFAPTLLRLAAAVAFAYGAYYIFKNRKRIGDTVLPIFVRAAWLPGASALVHLVIAFLLGTGYNTQIAAILGALGSIKGFFLSQRYPEVFPFSRSTYALLFVILLSLILSGAG